MLLSQFITKHDFKLSVTRIDSRPDTDSWTKDARHFRCKLSYQKRSMTLYFSQGSAHHKDPSLTDVLGCLQMDISSCQTDFESWASDLGYNTDSRSAEKTYKIIQKQSKSLKRVMGSIFQDFLDCENDY